MGLLGERSVKENCTRCKRCGRKLKDKESMERGMGKVCWNKYQAEQKNKLIHKKTVVKAEE